MLKKYTYLLSLFVLTLLVISCHTDVGEVNPGTEQSNQITVPLNFGEVEGELVGYIFDNENNPIADATVSIYSSETKTNEFGVFTFKNAKLDPQGTFIKAEKSGYIVGSDMVYPNSNGKGTSRIQLLKVLNEPVFQASEGGVIDIEGGGKITFGPSSLIRSSGSIYDGEVKSTVYLLSSLDSDLGVQMPGGLFGIDNKGRHRVLSTFGILAIELRGFDNQKLRLKSDQVAELTFPIESQLQSSVEDVISGWHFDFVDGLWHEGSPANFEQQYFTTTIDALGFWNFAIPDQVSQVCGRLKYNNELPAKNRIIQIINNGLPSRIGITDQDGFFCGKIPLGEQLQFQVLHSVCGELLHEMSIGPFEEVGTIGDVILEVDEKYVSGTIECLGELNSNSTIIVASGGHTNVFFPNANGSFSINLDDILCNELTTFSVFAYDNASETSSEPKELTAEFSESLRLEICGGECVAQPEFRYEKEDYCADGEYGQVFIEVFGGSGDYSYEWQNGSKDQYFNNLIAGEEICVTVIDLLTACEYIFCDEVSIHRRLSLESITSYNTECLMTSGEIAVDIVGGRAPILYEWTGPEGFVSSDAQLKGLSPGTYSLRVYDAAECEATETVEIYDVTRPIQSSKDDFCDYSVITIEDEEGYKPYVFNWDGGTADGNKLIINNPGEYRLTITDANLCTRTKTISISNVGVLPDINTIFECEEGIVLFTDLQNGYDYYYQPIGSNDNIPAIFVQGSVDVPILESGYRFELGSENEMFPECYASEVIELPRFEGLEIGEVTGVSCDSCEDGSIVYELNMDEDCIDCNVGEVKVVRRENMTDVTELNDEKILGRGEYYVIVLDGNSGCYIAHSLVVVE